MIAITAKELIVCFWPRWTKVFPAGHASLWPEVLTADPLQQLQSPIGRLPASWHEASFDEIEAYTSDSPEFYANTYFHT